MTPQTTMASTRPLLMPMLMLIACISVVCLDGGEAADVGQDIVDSIVDDGYGDDALMEAEQACPYVGCDALRKSSIENIPVPVLNTTVLPKVNGCSSSSMFTISQQDSGAFALACGGEQRGHVPTRLQAESMRGCANSLVQSYP